MLTTTTDLLPSNYKIVKIENIIIVRGNLRLDQKKGFLDFSSSGESMDDIYARLINAAPKGCNGIIGIKISSVSQNFSDGAFEIVTLSGTPIKYDLE